MNLGDPQLGWSRLLSENIEACSLSRRNCIRGIDKVGQELSYEEFVIKYMLPNIPCILESWVTSSWLSVKEWKDDQNNINWDCLNDKFGTLEVPVVECNNSSMYSSTNSTTMPFSEFVNYMKSSKEKEHSHSCLYLKDWHCYRQNLNYKFYETPIYFQSDWLNEFWENKEDDYRFVYIGPKGSWTPLHADVFKSYSWSANVCGKKRWIIYSPCTGCHEFEHPEKFEVVQEEGEIIFVPSGWHHEVYNIENTISINHNWINALNVDICWKFLREKLEEVVNEISEHKNMASFEWQCQMILRADSGMDYADFFNFLHFIAKKRIAFLSPAHTNSEVSDLNIDGDNNNRLFSYNFSSKETTYISNEWQWVIDLNRINHCLTDFLKVFKRLSYDTQSSIEQKCGTNIRQCSRAVQKFISNIQ